MLNTKIKESIKRQALADDLFTSALCYLEKNDIEAAKEMISYGFNVSESIEQRLAYICLKQLTNKPHNIIIEILNEVYGI